MLMFVQIIEGHTKDAEGLRRRGETWQVDVRPGATGFIGGTSGITADGQAVTVACFEDEAAARANSARPEQDAWWSETEKFFDGDVTFTESSDTVEFLGGPSADARFVQVMKASGVDRSQVARMDSSFERFADLRPDVLGSLRVWTGNDSTFELAYFTNEADARQGESAEMPAEFQELMAEFGDLMANTQYLDLVDPEIL
jgi:hypothetical protein